MDKSAEKKYYIVRELPTMKVVCCTYSQTTVNKYETDFNSFIVNRVNLQTYKAYKRTKKRNKKN